MISKFQQVLSLGPDCRTKHHMEKRFGQYVIKGGIFDWQATPNSALIEYFRRDFTGVFELRDLVVVDGAVRNAKFGTSHKHFFPADMTEELLVAHYPAARQRHDFGCRATQRALRSGYSTLFLLGRPATPEHLVEMTELIRRAHAGRKFEILPAPEGDRDDIWSGDDDVWAKHLSSFKFRPPLKAIARVHFRNLRRRLQEATRK